MRLALPTRLAARAGEGSGEEVPGQQAGEGEHGVGHAVGAAADAEHLVEDDREDDHRDDGVQHGPQHAQHGLLVADEDVPPGEEVEQLAVLPQLAELQPHPALRRLDDERRAVTALSALNVRRHCEPFLESDGEFAWPRAPPVRIRCAAKRPQAYRAARLRQRGVWRLFKCRCRRMCGGFDVGTVAGRTLNPETRRVQWQGGLRPT